MQQANYLNAGIYTIPEAARLVETTPARIRGWLFGHPNSHSDPVIHGELPKIGRQAALGFQNLIEARFINGFANEGLSVQSIRVMAEEARKALNDEHPFAKDFFFKTDGKSIFLEIWDRTAKRMKLYDLYTRNWAIDKVLRPFLREPVEFDHSGVARLWHPRKDAAPNIVVTPNFAFGHPVTERTGVPTRTLVDALHAENRNYQSVSRWFEVSVEEIQEAEKFENLLYGNV